MTLRKFTLGLVCLAARSLAVEPGGFAIDKEEWRDQPVRHFYVHGVWNRNTAFRICLPDPKAWKGRVLQSLQSLGGSETVGDPGYALGRGAVYVESSQGHIGQALNLGDHTAAEATFEASHSVVQYAKQRCIQLYGKPAAYTYVTGGSIAGVRASGLLERFPADYDGAVPTVGAGNVAFHEYVDSLIGAYGPVIQPMAAALNDAVRPGGSGKLFELLRTPGERHALEMILRAGFPKNGLWRLGSQPMGGGPGMMDIVKYEWDPTYFEDFWKSPGYAGADGKCKGDLVEGIEGVIAAAEPKSRTLTIDLSRPDDTFVTYTIVMTTGKAQGRRCTILRNAGPKLAISPHGPGVDGIQPGDHFTLNNRDRLAWQWLRRSMVRAASQHMEEFVVEGEPGYAQRPAEKIRAVTEPDRPMGAIRGKMIAVFGADDPFAPPSLAVRYHRYVRAALGSETENHFRIHFVEHGGHGFVFPEARDRMVAVSPVSRKAIDDLMAWVERGIAPAPGTQYQVDSMNQLVLPNAASDRKGYQPVVQIRCRGAAERVEIGVGQEVSFQVEAEDPDNELARLDMDFEGSATFAPARTVSGKKASAEFRYRYQKPGTYFATARVTDSTPGADGIQNLAAIRVVVR